MPQLAGPRSRSPPHGPIERGCESVEHALSSGPRRPPSELFQLPGGQRIARRSSPPSRSGVQQREGHHLPRHARTPRRIPRRVRQPPSFPLGAALSSNGIACRHSTAMEDRCKGGPPHVTTADLDKRMSRVVSSCGETGHPVRKNPHRSGVPRAKKEWESGTGDRSTPLRVVSCWRSCPPEADWRLARGISRASGGGGGRGGPRGGHRLAGTRGRCGRRRRLPGGRRVPRPAGRGGSGPARA